MVNVWVSFFAIPAPATGLRYDDLVSRRFGVPSRQAQRKERPMTDSDIHCHTASIAVAVTPKAAFAFMSDGVKQGEWSFGSWQRRRVGDGLYTGTSLFTGQQSYVSIKGDSDKLLIDYAVGADPDNLSPRIMARIIPGDVLGLAPGHCLISLIVWRTADMSDERWHLLAVSHETEMYLIRHLLESQT